MRRDEAGQSDEWACMSCGMPLKVGSLLETVEDFVIQFRFASFMGMWIFYWPAWLLASILFYSLFLSLFLAQYSYIHTLFFIPSILFLNESSPFISGGSARVSLIKSYDCRSYKWRKLLTPALLLTWNTNSTIIACIRHRWLHLTNTDNYSLGVSTKSDTLLPDHGNRYFRLAMRVEEEKAERREKW